MNHRTYYLLSPPVHIAKWAPVRMCIICLSVCLSVSKSKMFSTLCFTGQCLVFINTTVNPNTLWSYFRVDISATTFLIAIKLYTLYSYVKCEVLQF